MSDMLGNWTLDTVQHTDALTLLRGLPDDSVDMFFIDPPYGNNNGVGDLAAARAKDRVAGGRQSGDIMPIANDDYEGWKALMFDLLPEINRTLKSAASCCCCCTGGGGSEPRFAELALWMDKHMEFFHAVVWDKSKRGDGMGWRYRRNYEFVMVGHKRGGKLSWDEGRGARPNVVRSRPTQNEFHPTEKPIALVEEFILNHTHEGSLVVDCFCGSGTTGLAAVNTGRHYLLGDSEAIHVATAVKRLSMPSTPYMFAALEQAP